MSTPLCLAHKGIPYEVLVDHSTSFGKLSVSSDPDVGEGIFLITLNTEKELLNLQVAVQARSLEDKATVGPIEAHRDQSLEQRGERMGFKVDLPFTHAGPWEAEVTVTDGLRTESQKISVNVTEPGPTKIEFLIYALPFLALGILLLIVIIRKKKSS